MSLLSKFRKRKGSSNYKDDILENICDLLNTKKGFGSYPRDLGLDSYIYLGSDKKIVLQISADIKACVEKYEKRVQEIEIIHVPSKNRFFISFVIKCRIENSLHSFRLSFHHQQNSYSLGEKE